MALRRALAGHGNRLGDLMGAVTARMLEPRVATKYDPSRGSVLQFAIGIARKVAQEESRRNRRCARGVVALAAQEIPAAPERCPLERAELSTRIAAELASLPDRDRELVVRRFGFGAPDPASEPLSGSDRGRLVRILRRMRGRLADLLP